MAKKMMITCPRCDGKGELPQYHYNRDGICFRCWGRKKVEVNVPEGRTADEVFNGMRKRELAYLTLRPAKQDAKDEKKGGKMQPKNENKAIEKPTSKVDINKVDAEIMGLSMVKQFSGEETVRQRLEDAGIDISSKDTFDEVLEKARKHLLSGGNFDRKTDGSIGKEGIATTEKGTVVKTRYKVVEADDLITSHDLNGNENNNFPKELQPRDRSKGASKMQINEIANNLDFNRLGSSPLASSGSPIVAKDKIVESGNGRILGVKKAYDSANKSSLEYKAALLKNANEYGLDSETIKGMKKPVLIRERISDVDRVQFTKEANESGVSTMSASEQAKEDASKLSDWLMNLYKGGDLKSQDNKEFINEYMKNIISTADRNKFITEKVRDGLPYTEISTDGSSRVRNAMFYKAYSDAQLIQRKVELGDDSSVRAVISKMEEVAPKMAKMKAEIEAGFLYNHDITLDLLPAVKMLDELRRDKKNIAEYITQTQLLGEQLTREQKMLMYMLETMKGTPSLIGQFFNTFINEVYALGDPNEIDMFAAFDEKGNADYSTEDLFLLAYSKLHIPDTKEVKDKDKKSKEVLKRIFGL